MADEGEHTPSGVPPWQRALQADAALDRVMAEALERIGKLGANDTDKLIAAQILGARPTLALADALHGVREQLGLVADHVRDLNARVVALTNKFPAVD
jgi:hypothetical protein